MSDFWQFTLTIAAWIFLCSGIITLVIYLVFYRKSVVAHVFGAAIGMATISILVAMFIWLNKQMNS